MIDEQCASGAFSVAAQLVAPFAVNGKSAVWPHSSCVPLTKPAQVTLSATSPAGFGCGGGTGGGAIGRGTPPSLPGHVVEPVPGLGATTCLLYTSDAADD